eukprot:TRINITY_DN76604_c0_g1_i1.p1 TRINITY_DN76604_c0_g1~~TRINITY_DN76604_c0_g1_i1.p1  ORF type:complete len:242 (+),score=35.52 TRINITY_DN76604_c0_g1_i1:91-816(+)
MASVAMSDYLSSAPSNVAFAFREPPGLEKSPRALHIDPPFPPVFGSAAFEAAMTDMPIDRSRPSFQSELLTESSFYDAPSIVKRPVACVPKEGSVQGLHDQELPGTSTSCSEDEDSGAALSDKCQATVVPVTTLMLQNLPCRIRLERLEEELINLGFAGTYDFLHIPLKNNSNLGYGFVNFINAQVAARFREMFRDYEFSGTASKKRCCTSPAAIQGFEANHEAFRWKLSSDKLVTRFYVS